MSLEGGAVSHARWAWRGDRPCWVLTIKVSNKPGMSLDEIRVFLKASEAVHFVGEKKEEVYAGVSGCLGEQNWDALGRTARGAAAIYGEDDGAEPRTDHASDHPIRGGWRRAG